MLRVLIYCPVFYPQNSGYANAFLNLLKALSNQGNINIDVLTPHPLDKQTEVEIPHVNIIRYHPVLRVKFLGLFYSFQRLANKIKQLDRQNNYDTIFIETGDDSLLPFFMSNKLLAKTVVRFHATSDTESTVFFTRKKNRLNRFVMKKNVIDRLHYIAATNSYHIDFIKQYFLESNPFKISSKDFFVVANCLSNYKAPSIAPPGKTLKMVTLGRMDKEGYLQKGFNDLLNALIIANDQLKGGRIDLKIIGKGKYLPMLKNKAKQAELEYVHFIEDRSNEDIHQLLNEADIVILPSRFEGLSMFAIEAMASGNALLFSDAGALAEMINGNGYTFKAQHAVDLADKLIQLVNTNNEAIVSMKKRSQELYQQSYTSQIVANQFSYLVKIISTDNKK